MLEEAVTARARGVPVLALVAVADGVRRRVPRAAGRDDARGVGRAKEIGVRDTGRGISQAHLSRIFERFYRADPGRARESGGTGLGLAIVKHLAEAHGGTVQATSKLGDGTTVTVTFPP